MGESSSERGGWSRAFGAGIVQDLGQRDAQCERHGAYVSHGRLLFGHRELWTSCAVCVREADAEAQARAEGERVQERQKRLERVIPGSAVPSNFRHRTFDDYLTEEDGASLALRVARGYATDFAHHRREGNNLVLIGSTGTGKTHLACAILQSVLARGYTGLYLKAMDVVRRVRETWRSGAEHSASTVLAALTRADLLVIDEIGAQHGTGGEQLIVSEVLEGRYDACAPTVILGNEDMRGVRGCIGERAFDRLREKGRVVTLNWSSYRAKAQGWSW